MGGFGGLEQAVHKTRARSPSQRPVRLRKVARSLTRALDAVESRREGFSGGVEVSGVTASGVAHAVGEGEAGEESEDDGEQEREATGAHLAPLEASTPRRRK